MSNRESTPDANRDPITGTPGAHPVGVAAGGTAGALAGAAIGSLFGPIGTLVGGGIGAVGGAAGGKSLAERVDPTAEVEYWRQDAGQRDYYQRDRDFDRDYAPPIAWAPSIAMKRDARMERAESQLKSLWDETAANPADWERARPAVEDAYTRADRTYRAMRTPTPLRSAVHKRTTTTRTMASTITTCLSHGTQARHRGRTPRGPLTPSPSWSAAGTAKGQSRLGWQKRKRR